MFFSFASALYFLGHKVESELMQKGGNLMEHNDADKQVQYVRELMRKSSKFEKNPVIWKGKLTKYFDVFMNTSDNPTIIIPLGGDRGIYPDIATVGNYIFDSTSSHKR
jgi:hypothetical protein